MLTFKIEKCDYNDNSAGCHQKDWVEDYISDIQLDSWVMYSRMNFTERGGGSPTFRVSDFFFSTVLNTD